MPIALGTSERGDCGLPLTLGRARTLSSCAPRADGILLLLEVGHVLPQRRCILQARRSRNYQKHEPHTKSSPADLRISKPRRADHFFCARLRAVVMNCSSLRSAQRFFIAIDRPFLPAWRQAAALVRFFSSWFLRPADSLLLATLLRPDKAAPADPSRALMARPSRSRSFAKSATIFS